MIAKLQKELMQLEEIVLTREVINPLIEKLHPGRIEYTHSSIESGRDIVSFGTDSINRSHVLCVQIKADKVTYGAQFHRIVVSPTKMAKMEGVTLENGNKCAPNEVWFITSAPFPEQQRRQVSETLNDLEKNNIKFIAGEELSNLIIKTIPDIAKKICRYADKEIVDFMSLLSMNNDGIAFEMNKNIDIDDFYVTASFSPYLRNKNLTTEDIDLVTDYSHSFEAKINDYLLDDDEKTNLSIENLILDREKSREKSSKFQEIFNVEFNIEIESFYKKGQNKAPTLIQAEYINKEYQDIKTDDICVKLRKSIYLEDYYKNLLTKARNNISTCPKKLTKNYKKVISTLDSINKLDSFIYSLSREFSKSFNRRTSDELHKKIELQVQVPEPEYLVNLGQLILVEGPPGCGKTTLLKKLAISLLSKNKKIKYLTCCSINSLCNNESLVEIVNKFSLGDFHNAYKNEECVLIIDGLDESPFDLTSKIIKDSCLYYKVILSSRSSHSTSIRDNCFNIMLSPFSTDERNNFFRKILKNDPEKINQALHLFENYPDIDNHTKLPIIAMLTATLLKNDFTPTTRSEIYNFRLDLLLSKWDRVRGLSRIKIDNPKAKITFLTNLAYRMHSFETKNRFISEVDLKEIYEKSLGGWGYGFDYKTFINDLVMGSGVLLEIYDNKFTFGHLSFQEHLAGEYLSKNCSTKEILNLLGNDWWREPLNFWASSKGNITELLDKILETPEYIGFTSQLLEMCGYAPYTSAGIVEILQEGSFSNEI